MSTNVTFNGTTYQIPALGDNGWATVVSNYLIAISTGTFQKSGGAFTLTAETDFGANFGLKTLYFRSRATNPSATGVVRLGNTELVSWRNAGNTADLGLTVSALNALQFNGADIIAGGTGQIVNADVSPAAAIAYSKLNLFGSILDSDLAGAITAAKLVGTDIATVGTVTAGTWQGTPIAAMYLVGTDIVTVGTVTAGTWSADTIALNKGGTGQVTKAAAFDALSPMTTSGDITYGGASGTGTRLGKGTDGQALVLTAGIPSWGTVATNPMTTGGDVIYGGASGAPTRLPNGSLNQYLKSAGGTSAPSWATFTPPTVQKFTSGPGTYTTPAGVKWIKVCLVGGGGGGAGSGTTAGSTGGGSGGNTFFRVGASPEILVGGGAVGGDQANIRGGLGGSITVNSPAIDAGSMVGNPANGTGQTGAAALFPGSNGGSSRLGGSGRGGAGETGTAATSNSGSGGGGGGTNLTASANAGPGGGSGGFVEAIIVAPSATYSYGVGAGGTAGGAGASGHPGGAGGTGAIIVEEHYQ